MTKWAVVFIMAGSALYLVAGQTQVGWLYLFDAIIWSLLALAEILPYFVLKSLKVEQRVLLSAGNIQASALNGPIEDENIEIQIKVTNAGYLTRYFIKLTADCPFEQSEARRNTFLLLALKRGVTTFSHTVGCYRRGHYSSSEITLESGGFLGLFVRRRKFTLPMNLTIYPRYYPMENSSLPGELWDEWGHGVKANSASEFYGARNYQYGDSLKHIHWRNTARSGHFMIKEFERAGEGLLTVILDNSQDFGDGRETTFEYSIKIAASLAKLCAGSGRRLDIIAGEDALYDCDWQEAMDFLTRLRVSKKGVQPESPLISSTGRALVIITPAVVNSQTSALLNFAARERGILVTLEGFAADVVPREVLLPGERGLEIIHCMKGSIKEAVRDLGMQLSMSGDGNAG